MNRSSNTSVADIVALVGGIAMVVGFLFMPWISFLGLSATGWSLLGMANAAANNPNVHADTSGVFWLLLILIAGICGTATAIWGLARPEHRRAASIGSLVAGLVGLTPFAVLMMQTNWSQTNSSTLNLGLSFIGIGVWVTLMGAIGLVVQALIPRPIVQSAPLPAQPVPPADTLGNFRLPPID